LLLQRFVLDIFFKLISNNKLRFPNVCLQFIALLQPAVLWASLHLQTSYTTDGANVCNDFSDGLGFFFRKSLYLSRICICIYRPRGAVDCTESFCPTKPGFSVAGLLKVFIFQK